MSVRTRDGRSNATLAAAHDANAAAVLEHVRVLHDAVLRFEDETRHSLEQVHPEHADSARNLLHYLALRRHDIRELQTRLAGLGLSSLGRAESSVLTTLKAVLRMLTHLAGGDAPTASSSAGGQSMAQGKASLEENTRSLLGADPPARRVRIMVTMPAEAGCDYELVRQLLVSGMDCMRINCAHDDRTVWQAMVENLRRARDEVGKPCAILMDLGGPKLRTGRLAPGPRVLKVRPERDELGRLLEPARLRLAPDNADLPADAPTIPVPAEWLANLRESDWIRFDDARGARRELLIVQADNTACWADLAQTAYFVPGLRLRPRRRDKKSRWCKLPRAQIGAVPAQPQTLRLKSGDRLLLTSGESSGKPAVYDDQGCVMAPASIPCTLPEVLRDLTPGESIWFDDGKIGGVVRAVHPDHAEIEITQARREGSKLAADKGINLPDTRLSLPSLTEQDLENLPFVVEHADLVGYSFVRSPQDVQQLQEHLRRLNGEHLGIVLKIETRQAFDHLPQLLLTALANARVGVMIARGDLMVECGYERLAEMQEEILWVCEAAHVPVIWATQVLENLAKEGQPSRAEITDAAMGERAECVMLNKGPHILEAVHVLDNILRRMEAHQHKKRAMLRPLKLADRFAAE